MGLMSFAQTIATAVGRSRADRLRIRVQDRLEALDHFTGHDDSRPPPGVLPADTEFKNVIALTL
jgi:hypothetical protein